MPPEDSATPYSSSMRATACASPCSSPHSEAAVPEMRQSPVAGLSWKGTPRAKLPGKRLT